MTSLPRTVFCLIVTIAVSGCVSSADPQPAAEIVEAENLLSQGVARYQAQDYPAAQQLFRQALLRYRLIDHPQGIVTSTVNIARNLLASGKPQQAQHWLRQAKHLNQQYRPANRQQLAQHLRLLEAAIDIEQQRNDSAIEVLQPLLQVHQNSSQNDSITLVALQLRTRIAQQQNRDVQQWIQRYRQSIQQAGKPASHLARLARFEAGASSDAQQQNRLYRQALKYYREQANRTGIAATLGEWAEQEIVRKEYAPAQDKLLRALLIRIALQDTPHTQKLLHKLETVYQFTDQSALQQTREWRQRLQADSFDQWQALMQAFDPYPD